MYESIEEIIKKYEIFWDTDLTIEEVEQKFQELEYKFVIIE